MAAHLTRWAVLAAISVLLAACPTSGLAIRVWNHSGRKVAVYLNDRHRTTIRDGHNAVVGRLKGPPDAYYSISVEDWANTIACDQLPASLFTAAATRPARNGDGTEFCLEFSDSQLIYALDGATLRRLEPQPPGFPLHPIEIK
ncbi:MAG TPA: hypothetical protein VGL42_04995 [Opitutaceae bacterium]|jgi:hypothetical protein